VVGDQLDQQRGRRKIEVEIQSVKKQVGSGDRPVTADGLESSRCLGKDDASEIESASLEPMGAVVEHGRRVIGHGGPDLTHLGSRATLGTGIVDNLGWRWVFYVNLPVGIAAVTLVAVAMVEPLEHQHKHRVDYPGILTFVVLTAFHVGYAAAAAVLAGVGMLIPFLGPLLAIIPPLLIAAFWVTSVGQFVWIFLILWVTQQLLVNVLAPRLLGDVVGMHPLLVLFALFAGATVAGIWGALFGVPVAAVGFLMVRDFYHEVLEPSRYYATGESRTMGDSVPSTLETSAAGTPGRSAAAPASR